MLLPEGTLLEKRYFIKNILGKGGMGAVYLAEDRRLDGRYVAVKEMLITTKVDNGLEKAIAQFKKEAHMLAKLDHPHLPKVIDYFEDGEKQYLVMEYIKGKTLKELIEEKEEPFSEEEVIKWGLDISSALAHLHDHSPPIVFRDLKPQNIMINSSGQLKLIDFGIAKIFAPTEETDTFIQAKGSMGYCPPEQCSPKGKTDPRTDIYSLAATLHYLLTKRNPSDLPFVFPPLRELRKDASEELEKVLLKALELDCDDRYKNTHDLIEDLRKVLPEKSEGIEAWLTKWWSTVAITLAAYGAGLIAVRSLLHFLKSPLGLFYKPVSFISLFIYLFIPIGGLIWYLQKNKFSINKEAEGRRQRP